MKKLWRFYLENGREINGMLFGIAIGTTFGLVLLFGLLFLKMILFW